MKWGRGLFLLAAAMVAAQADELHLRDGTVIIGAYVGGTTKEIYFQHTPAGSDMYPVFLVESVKFNPAPSLTPGAALKSPSHSTAPGPVAVRPALSTAAAYRAASAAPMNLAARIKWVFALFLPPPLAAQSAYPAH